MFLKRKTHLLQAHDQWMLLIQRPPIKDLLEISEEESDDSPSKKQKHDPGPPEMPTQNEIMGNLLVFHQEKHILSRIS